MAKAAKPKSTRPAAPKSPKGAAKASAPGSEVERRWKDYWERRSRLERAVEAVRAASAELKKAQEDEKARRAEFEEVKRSLTTLLDVDPVGAPARDPIPLPRGLPEPPKQVG
jgi:outer membrane protein TolC